MESVRCRFSLFSHSYRDNGVRLTKGPPHPDIKGCLLRVKSILNQVIPSFIPYYCYSPVH